MLQHRAVFLEQILLVVWGDGGQAQHRVGVAVVALGRQADAVVALPQVGDAHGVGCQHLVRQTVRVLGPETGHLLFGGLSGQHASMLRSLLGMGQVEQAALGLSDGVLETLLEAEEVLRLGGLANQLVQVHFNFGTRLHCYYIYTWPSTSKSFPF